MVYVISIQSGGSLVVLPQKYLDRKEVDKKDMR
jgi:hypothetical protein